MALQHTQYNHHCMMRGITFMKTSEGLKLILVFGILVIISCGYYLSRHEDWYARKDVVAINDNYKNRRETFHESAAPTATTPKPQKHQDSAKVLVLVMTRRSSIETRDIIRETWANGHDNVRFVIGKPCSIPPKHRKPWTCIEKDKPSPTVQAAFEEEENATESALTSEKSRHGDIFMVDEIDVYRHLPHKLKAAYAWALKETKVEWIVKTDDDTVVRVDTLVNFLVTKFDSSKPTVIGHIVQNAGILRSGKWAELDYKKKRYPPWPQGSFGHVVSRPVAKYIVQHSDQLFNYQGEDVSLGIWLDESPMKNAVVWNSTKAFTNGGDCMDKKFVMIGHDIGATKMKQCFAQMDETPEMAAHISKNASSYEIIYKDPLTLDITNRFDIVVKTVYAIYLKRGGNVFPLARETYIRHLEVWNNLTEPCKFRGDDEWFDAIKPCVKKSGAADFEKSFNNTLHLLAEKGFNNSISIVPVTAKGFPLKGAHRIASAIALGFKSMPVQRVANSNVYHWDKQFFMNLGLETKYVDFALRQWNLHVRNSSVEDRYWLDYVSNYTGSQNLHVVIVFPSTKGKHRNDIVKLIAREASILTQRYISLTTRDAADMFVQHLYPKESWVDTGGSRGKTKLYFPKGTEQVATWILFIQTPSPLSNVLSIKDKIMKIFNIGKHSIHISNTSEQTRSIARIVLNQNSLQMLRYIKWSSPSQRRRHASSTSPTSLD